jgi:CRISPR-associated protein Cas1
MNPLHLDGFGVEVQASNLRAGKELLIQNGRENGNLPERYIFKPRQCPHDSIIIEGKSGHISLQALRWLSYNKIPVFLMGYDGSVISSILPPVPVKADLRISQIQASADMKKKFTIAYALVEAKIIRSLEVLGSLAERYKIQSARNKAEREARALLKASKFSQFLSVEAHVARTYWEAYAKIMPERLHFQGRLSDSRNSNATDPMNAALNYAYGYLKCECRMAVNTVGLEPAVGFLHETSYSQTAESLVYDLMEPFRFLCDLTVVQAFESGWLDQKDFAYTRDNYLFKIEFEARRRFLHLLRNRFNSGTTYKGRRLRWDTVIEEKTNDLARYLTGSRRDLSFTEQRGL